jgi:hypothetical protein
MNKPPQDRIRVIGRSNQGHLLLALDPDFENEFLDSIGRATGRRVLS